MSPKLITLISLSFLGLCLLASMFQEELGIEPAKTKQMREHKELMDKSDEQIKKARDELDQLEGS